MSDKYKEKDDTGLTIGEVKQIIQRKTTGRVHSSKKDYNRKKRKWEDKKWILIFGI
jgi:hypothetical protein